MVGCGRGSKADFKRAQEALKAAHKIIFEEYIFSPKPKSVRVKREEKQLDKMKKDYAEISLQPVKTKRRCTTAQGKGKKNGVNNLTLESPLSVSTPPAASKARHANATYTAAGRWPSPHILPPLCRPDPVLETSTTTPLPPLGGQSHDQHLSLTSPRTLQPYPAPMTALPEQRSTSPSLPEDHLFIHRSCRLTGRPGMSRSAVPPLRSQAGPIMLPACLCN